MAPDAPAESSEYEETASLVRELDALKRHGSNLLVVGAEKQLGRAGLCEHFLGESSAAPRRRMFVFTDSECRVRDRLMNSADQSSPDRLQVVRFESADRSAATATQPAGMDPAVPETRVHERSLTRLGIVISEGIDAFESASGSPLESAEFRLCFDSLAPLLAEFEREPVFRFVHLLTHRVRSVNGMAHFHLPVTRSDPIVGTLEPLFDAVIEFSIRNGTLKQRWTLRNGDLDTDWLAL